MLRVLRENSSSWIIKVLFSLIIATFIFWGGYSGLKGCGEESTNGSPDVIARVNKGTISRMELVMILQDRIRAQRQQFPDQFKEGLPKELEDFYRKLLLDQMINQRLIVEATGKTPVPFSKKQVQDMVVTIPAFQDPKTKTFNFEFYTRALTYMQKTPKTFERELSQDIQNQGYINLFTSSIIISDDELYSNYEYEHQKAALDFYKISSSSFASKITPTDAEIKAHYDANAKKYVSDELREISFIRFYEKGIPLTELEKRGNAFLVAYDSKKSFEENAIAQKLTIQKSKPFAKKDAPEEIEQSRVIVNRAFALKAQELSELIRVRNESYYVVYVTAVTPSATKPLGDVKQEIITELKETGGKKEAETFAQKIINDLADGTAFSAIKTKYKLSLDKTEEFSRSRFNDIPKIGRSEAIMAMSFNPAYNKKPILQYFPVESSYYVVFVNHQIQANKDEFNTDKPSLQYAEIAERKNLILSSLIETLKNKATITRMDDKKQL